eukprot:m51a1_g12892 hypothetical protein (175) ;mRNA; r:1381-2574
MSLIATKIIEWSAEDQNKLFDEVSKIPGIDTFSITSFEMSSLWKHPMEAVLSFIRLERRWFSTLVIPLFPENKNVFKPQEKDKKIHYDLVIRFLTPSAQQFFLDSLNVIFVCMPVDRTEELYRSSMPHIKYETIAELLLSVYNHCSPRSKETEVTNYVKDIFFHFNIAVPYFDP